MWFLKCVVIDLKLKKNLNYMKKDLSVNLQPKNVASISFKGVDYPYF